MRSALVVTAFLLAALPISQSAAQSDWLKKGKDLLDSSGVTSGSGDSGASALGGLSNSEITDGLREALKVGSQRVVDQVGQTDGYNADSSIHLPLPDSLKKVQSALELAGLSSMLDDLELRLLRDLDRFLAGYHDQRESAQSGISCGRREVCRPWSQRGKAYTGFTGKTSIGCRHEPCPLLVPGNDQTDRRGPQ